MIGIPVSFALRIRHRVITRHHGNIHHRQHLKGVWMDIILNKLTTLIISPTQTIKELLVQKEHVDPTKVHVVNHGIDERYYASKDKNAQKRLRDKYAIPETHPIIGVISRHIDWKGIQYIIPAFEKLLHQSKGAHLILANAIGPYRSTVEKLLTPLPANSYTMIEYESDVSSLYSLFDYFVHVPIDSQSESFGLVYIEALAAGVPSVFTLSGVAPDFVKNKYNAMVVDFMNSNQIYVALTTLMNDSTLVQQLIDNGRKSAQCYSSSTMGEKIRNLYEQMESGRSILSL
jgi:glycosyltransferase involved in cell wall biosynthesis